MKTGSACAHVRPANFLLTGCGSAFAPSKPAPDFFFFFFIQPALCGFPHREEGCVSGLIFHQLCLGVGVFLSD